CLGCGNWGLQVIIGVCYFLVVVCNWKLELCLQVKIGGLCFTLAELGDCLVVLVLDCVLWNDQTDLTVCCSRNCATATSCSYCCMR
ncbi:hypothetical protein GIB67_008213, partial [Kingdonia uniflora]